MRKERLRKLRREGNVSSEREIRNEFHRWFGCASPAFQPLISRGRSFASIIGTRWLTFGWRKRERERGEFDAWSVERSTERLIDVSCEITGNWTNNQFVSRYHRHDGEAGFPFAFSSIDFFLSLSLSPSLCFATFREKRKWATCSVVCTRRQHGNCTITRFSSG